MINEELTSITKKGAFVKVDEEKQNEASQLNNNMIDTHLVVDNHQYENFYSNNEFNINLDSNHDDDLISSSHLHHHHSKIYHEEEEHSFLPSDIIEYNYDIAENFFVGRDPFSNENETKKKE